jgi:hypothetical protein
MVRRDNWAGRKFCMTMRLGLTGLCLTTALLFAGGTLLGQSAIQINGMDVAAGTDEESGDSSAPYVIFSNLGSRDDLYSTSTIFAKAIVARQVGQTPEQWEAIRFVPKVDVQATVLEAAVGYISGTKIVQLGIYDNNEALESPGALLPGGQGSTTDIPDLGECCQLIKVTLPGTGVTLTAGTIYWLVASPDNVNGKSFNGAWQVAHLGEHGLLAPSIQPWVLSPSEWLATRIRGARLQDLGPLTPEKQQAQSDTNAASGRVTIFSNLNHFFSQPYFPGFGWPIMGNNVPFNIEEWQALPFTPKTSVQVTTLRVAIGHTTGTNLINLGIYSDSAGLPGSPLPGGQGSIADLPDSASCCEFATLRLAGGGVALTSGTQYWAVASPDNVNAPDFMGQWLLSTNNVCSTLLPEQSPFWTEFSGDWMAAQIAGSSQ